jgi:hypothetical protein
MAAGDVKVALPSDVTVTITLASLATSSTRVAGRESGSVSISTDLYLDYQASGKITVGTTPTSGGIIEVWVIAKKDDSNWPDVFDGTDSAETVTTRAQLEGYGRLIWSIAIPATTSDIGYEFSRVGIAEYFGGSLPETFVLFVTHSTGVNLNSTGGNHVITLHPIYRTVAQA